jgi:tetratricopeptide (TPR) repeat protein
MGTARCDHHAGAGGATTPLEDLKIARQALDEGDPKHAAFHAACALAVDARDGAALELADQILDAVPDPRTLFEIEAGTYYGLVALHCRALWQAGDRGAAIEQLGSVIGFKPEIGYATWLAPWFAAAGPQSASVAIQRAGERLGDADDAARAEVIAAGEEARRVFPDDERVGCMHGRNLRACGRYDEALAVLGAIDRQHRSYLTGVLYATTHKIAGDREGAVRLLEELCARFPDDDAIFLDLGDNRLDLGLYTAAAAAYQHVVARVPHHDWAYPSLLYAKFLDTGDLPLRDELEDAALVDGARRAKGLAHALAPYLGYLPNPPEAVLKVGAQIIRDGKPPGQLSLGLSSLEAPSAITSLRRFTESAGGGLALSTSVGDPDPRPPRAPVAIPTWTYADTVATPALPPPADGRIGDAITRLADQRFDGRRWLDDAADVARELGPDAARDIVAAMLHSPAPPSWASPLTWPWRFQIAAALVLANLEPDGTPWEPATSKRAAALESLILGPIDWLSTAGLVAVTRLCDREPALVPVATRYLDDAMAAPVSPIVHMCLRHPAAELLVQLPGASPSQRSARRAIRAEVAST